MSMLTNSHTKFLNQNFLEIQRKGVPDDVVDYLDAGFSSSAVKQTTDPNERIALVGMAIIDTNFLKELNKEHRRNGPDAENIGQFFEILFTAKKTRAYPKDGTFIKTLKKVEDYYIRQFMKKRHIPLSDGLTCLKSRREMFGIDYGSKSFVLFESGGSWTGTVERAREGTQEYPPFFIDDSHNQVILIQGTAKDPAQIKGNVIDVQRVAPFRFFEELEEFRVVLQLQELDFKNPQPNAISVTIMRNKNTGQYCNYRKDKFFEGEGTFPLSNQLLETQEGVIECIEAMGREDRLTINLPKSRLDALLVRQHMLKEMKKSPLSPQLIEWMAEEMEIAQDDLEPGNLLEKMIEKTDEAIQEEMSQRQQETLESFQSGDHALRKQKRKRSAAKGKGKAKKQDEGSSSSAKPRMELSAKERESVSSVFSGHPMKQRAFNRLAMSLLDKKKAELSQKVKGSHPKIHLKSEGGESSGVTLGLAHGRDDVMPVHVQKDTLRRILKL